MSAVQTITAGPSCSAFRAAPTRGPCLRPANSSRRVLAGAGMRVLGSGSSVPAAILSNADLEKLVETNDEWIVTRTGIRRRHILGPGESLAEHSTLAAQRALDMAGVRPEEVDLVILANSSPDDSFGSACAVQAALGAKNAAAYDLTAACSGFVMGTVTAAQFLRSGAYRNILVIGADALSRYLDWRDRGTCILFGDGAGAVLLQRDDTEAPDALLGFDMHSGKV